MGITPIKDATGLTDQLVTYASPAKNSDNSSGDFRSVWNDQAGARNSQDIRPNYAESTDKKSGNGYDNAADRQSEKKVSGDESRVNDSERTDASKTDVKGKDSPEAAVSEDLNDSVSGGNMLKDEEIVSAQETLCSAAAELAGVLTDILDITPEEFEGLLQAEGIENIDLLGKEELGAFMLKALGADSQLSLLTSEEAYSSFSNGMNALEGILASDTDIRDLSVAELKELADGLDIPELDDYEETVNSGTALVSGTEKLSDDDSVTRFVRNSDGDLEQVGLNDNGGITGEGKIVMKAAETETDGKESGGHGEEANPGPVFQDAVSDAAGRVNETETQQQVSYVTDANEIADQILDHMKTVTDGDFSDVEMQLHPASLGMVRVHVTNAAGVITASFITENEAVKAAVESQMVRLSEQFEAQGIRVDAVEVTIASHSFEGNLESGKDSSNEESGTPKRTRRINLGDDEDPDTSSLEDDERIAAEMMAANGNKVDYMA